MAKPIQKERENRSADKRDLIFHPFTITPETAHTAILLLLAKEPEVLCQTLRALTKFASQDTQNRLILFDQEAISYILPHLDHAELNIRRYALKAMALLCQLPQGPEQVLPNQNNLKKVAQHLVKGEDVFVLEFASLVLAELTREPVGCEQLVAANILGTLFSRMKNSQDPDVQKNCLQTLSNLLDDPVCAPEVTKNPNFSWPSLLALTTSQFLGIQHAALRTVDQLICRYKDQVVQKTFRSSTGVLDLCDILESYEFRDVHTQVLGVLRNYVEIEENAAHLYQSGCIFRLLAYLEMALPAMKPHCLAVLAKMSNTAAGREALYQTGTDLVFCQQLLTSNIELLADSALGVSNMTKLMPSALRMCDTNIIEALSSITCDESAPWFNTRVNAVRALAALSSYIPKAAYAVVEPKTFTAIRAINKKYKETPIEAQRLAVQCYINLLNYHISMNAMLNAEFMSELLNILQRIDTTLKIMACTVLTGMMSEQAGKDLFTLKGGEEVVSENLEIEHIGLRTALCTLIIASVTDEGADQYLEMGTLHYMVENKQARYVVSAWEPAIEAIFDHEPSAKFAYRGRLEINDFTREGFYVMKRLESPLPTLRKLALASPPHRHPALVALFMPPLPPKSDLDINNGNSSATRLSVSRHSRVRLPSLADDHNLREYLLKLKLWFGDPRLQLQLQLNRNRSKQLPHPFLSYGLESAVSQESSWTIERSSCGEYNYQESRLDILLKRDTHEALSHAYLVNQSLREFCTTTKSMQFIEVEDTHFEVRYREKCDEVSATLKQRAFLLAEFVQEQMSGLSFEKDCSMPSVDLHLGDLMVQLSSRVIGLGWVRSGGPLERAMLYKVLADRLAIPCALIRSGSGHACCQVAVPEVETEDDIRNDKRFPAGLLRVNYVVDLMSEPPQLLPLRSYEAVKVCGPWCNKPYTARAQMDVCKCENEEVC